MRRGATNVGFLQMIGYPKGLTKEIFILLATNAMFKVIVIFSVTVKSVN